MATRTARLSAIAVLAAAALAAFVLTAGPVFGGDTGSVNATVTPATPCITIGGASSIDFGSAALSQPGPQFGNEVAKPVGTSSITNCTLNDEQVFARATDAVGNGNPAANWALTPNLFNPCTAGTDKFSATTGNGTFTTYLSTINGSFVTLGPNQTNGLSFSMFMPCVGSSGGGQTMSFAYVYTVTF